MSDTDWTTTETLRSRREHIAVMAMQGLLAGRKGPIESYSDGAIAHDSIRLADALIAELDKKASGA